MNKSIKVKVDSHIFELKNLEVYERLTEETIAFATDIYIDGVCVGQCQNTGKGEGNYPYIGYEYQEIYNEIEKEVGRRQYIFRDRYGEHNWTYSMDFLIGMMVEDCWYHNKKTYKFC